MTPARTITAHIARIGYRKLIADAEMLAGSGALSQADTGTLRQALSISGCDDGADVYEWYERHQPDRLSILSGAFVRNTRHA